ncbi:MAG: 7-carboxy-7-deazaguanine synthase QueE [Gammaproteobacteria bacterium]|nr:7-carboxy-7-deazaguanine synthase QueE [Gammaproteobacteria bacterium]MDH5594241.1 7-carboxy-7-deazaguanine synthase QueE [Gammaproteobacteria bacterium]MDH5614779.1 7-carboxy-7-deazaguanine synthase QueE [Gammaproteobacteria bacterium]
MNLRITEIFYSLQGESRTAGFPTVFIRLTGCPLRCDYCDTTYAFQGGEKIEISDVLKRVAKYQPHYVTVTGGEPLAQNACLTLLSSLCDAGYEVSLETSGAIDVSNVDQRVIKVMDLKTPASGESEKNLYQNINKLNSQDQIKFVLGNRADYDWSKDIISEYSLDGKCEILFSPVHGKLEPVQLAEWILHDKLNVRMQIQLHKLLWGNEKGR